MSCGGCRGWFMTSRGSRRLLLSGNELGPGCGSLRLKRSLPSPRNCGLFYDLILLWQLDAIGASVSFVMGLNSRRLSGLRGLGVRLIWNAGSQCVLELKRPFLEPKNRFDGATPSVLLCAFAQIRGALCALERVRLIAPLDCFWALRSGKHWLIVSGWKSRSVACVPGLPRKSNWRARANLT